MTQSSLYFTSTIHTATCFRMVFSIYKIHNSCTLMFLYYYCQTIFDMQCLIIDQIKGSSNMLCSTTITRQPISCDLSYATTIYEIALCVMCFLSSCSSVTSRSSKLSHFCLSNTNFMVYISSCLYRICTSSLLLIC